MSNGEHKSGEGHDKQSQKSQDRVQKCEAIKAALVSNGMTTDKAATATVAIESIIWGT